MKHTVSTVHTSYIQARAQTNIVNLKSARVRYWVCHKYSSNKENISIDKQTAITGLKGDIELG